MQAVEEKEIKPR